MIGKMGGNKMGEVKRCPQSHWSLHVPHGLPDLDRHSAGDNNARVGTRPWRRKLVKDEGQRWPSTGAGWMVIQSDAGGSAVTALLEPWAALQESWTPARGKA